jgi:hypothetical protein
VATGEYMTLHCLEQVIPRGAETESRFPIYRKYFHEIVIVMSRVFFRWAGSFIPDLVIAKSSRSKISIKRKISK